MGWGDSDTSKLYDLFRSGEVDPLINDWRELKKVYDKYPWIQAFYPEKKKEIRVLHHILEVSYSFYR